jgi:DNA-directed RNA polymerase beta' subunit
MQLNFVNFEQLFDPEAVITNPEGVDKSKNFTPDGIYSETIFGNMYGNPIEYRCNCGETTGKFAEGTTCIEPSCKSVVTKRESVVRKQGWIDLGEYRIINPVFFSFVEKIVGKKRLKASLKFARKLDVDGNVQEEVEEGEDEIEGIGTHFFVEQFLDIINFCHEENTDSKGNNKYQAHYDLIIKNIDKILISKIPVFSHRLRPAIILGDELRFDKINNLFNRLLAASNSLHNLMGTEQSEMTVCPVVDSLQSFATQIYEMSINAISGKNGWMRSNLMANRVNFSARCVITPLSVGHDLDEVHMPYAAALELLRFHIINILVKMQKKSYHEALEMWHMASLAFDPTIYQVMMDIIDRSKDGVNILLNRNPTISFGSILYMRLSHIKTDFSDKTMSIPNNTLKLLAGDYDGDVLSVFLILDADQKKHFCRFSPKRMLISTNDGKFNRDLGLDKDNQLGLWSFMTSDKK